MVDPQLRAEVEQLLALHGRLTDDGALERYDEVFTDDVAYDVSALGGGVLTGVRALADAGYAMGERNPVAHVVTNVVVGAVAADRIEVVSTFLGVRADGTVGAGRYADVLVRTDDGWRISRRTVTPADDPLAGAYR